MLQERLQEQFNQTIETANNNQIYECLVELAREKMEGLEKFEGKKKLYYISAEFLLGRMLASNLVNLHLYDDIKEELEAHGQSLKDILALEKEPSLGNGGLGRLAACYIDSISANQFPGDGVGLLYHFGLFKQLFEDYKQSEHPDTWMNKNDWFRKTDQIFDVQLNGHQLKSVKYEMDVPGYHGKKNTLHLFDLESVDESLVKEGIRFDQTAVEKNLTLFLYPDDATYEGRLLRIYQQYFMVSSTAQLILRELKERGYALEKLHEHVIIQINDTHPSLVIPELIYRLTEAGISLDESVEIVRNSCAYTNHTILAEALEKWPLEMLEDVVPQLIPIIRHLDALARTYSDNPETYIIDDENRVHMAHMDIHFSKSTNGVAKLHTEILMETELNHFYQIYPEKFNNKTNGITFRRWLHSANPELHAYLQELLAADTSEDANALEKLLDFYHDETVLNNLVEIKDIKRKQFIRHIKTKQNVDLPENALIMTQIKRLHEYKRQQMNALCIIHKYLEIKAGKKPVRPLVFVFGAKAAPAYVTAKDIIHLLLVLSEVINQDESVRNDLRIVFIENYNVSEAEIIIPASDVSEQISLASKEASGTGNMKFMLNGALTLGTNDGANVEIRELVGDDNIFMFGESSDQVIEHYEKADYNASEYYYHIPVIKQALDFIDSEMMLKTGDTVLLTRLKELLIHKDWFMTLLDLEDYIKVKDEMINAYEDRKAWSQKMLVNIAKSGFFSSDRSIADYIRDLWSD